MKFCDAMDKLKSGSKVTREPWREGVYFMIDGNDVKSYQPRSAVYIYNEDIMVSDGWLIDNIEGEFKFCDIIPYLLLGAKARLKEWKESFICVDFIEQGLVINSMEIFSYMPQFTDFYAEDWIEV